jgi:hypothetical protein
VAKRVSGALLALMTMLTLSPALLSQATVKQQAKPSVPPPIPRTADGKPSLTGGWIRKNNRDVPSKMFTAEALPMQPAAAEKCKAIGCGTGDRGGPPEQMVDPVIARCAPPGFPRILQNAEPMEIFQIPGRMFMRFEHIAGMREIWTDGRGHPKDVDPTWYGHSIGKWDGDTFVIDTVGLNDYTWLDRAGHPHSDALHVVERIRRLDYNVLRFDLTFEDPKAYTKPFTGRVEFEFRPHIEIREVIECEDRMLAERPEDAFPFYVK